MSSSSSSSQHQQRKAQSRFHKVYNALKQEQQTQLLYLGYFGAFVVVATTFSRCICMVPAGQVAWIPPPPPPPSTAAAADSEQLPKILFPGLHLTNPLSRSPIRCSTRIQTLTIRPRLWSDRGTKIFVRTTLLFRLDPSGIQAFLQQGGTPNFAQTILKPQATSILHDIVTRTDLNDIYAQNRDQIGSKVCRELNQTLLSSMGIRVEDVWIENVDLSHSTNQKVQEAGMESWQKVIDKKKQDLQTIQDKGDDKVRTLLRTYLDSNR